MPQILDNTTNLETLLSEINNLSNGESISPTLQSKTVTPTTTAQEVTADSGYDGLEKVTVNAMPTATQATPSISVSSAGLITASSTQSAGYVSAGTKSATKQLTVQAAKTVTPSTSSQTAVASGRYTTGVVSVAGDANLVAGNIKSGVSIFGVAGSYTGSGDDSGSSEACQIATGSFTSDGGNSYTVSGLSFKPDGILIRGSERPSIYARTNLQSLSHGSLGAHYYTYNGANASGSAHGYTVTPTSSQLSVEYVEGGFTVNIGCSFGTNPTYYWTAVRTGTNSDSSGGDSSGGGIV